MVTTSYARTDASKKRRAGNPLRRRHLRELRAEFGKYLVIFLLMMLTIGLCSGYLVADGSMITAYNESFEKYNIESGNFSLEKKASPAQQKAIEEEGGIRIYELFYTEKELTSGSVLRLFRNRSTVDLPCVMRGRLPEGPGEIALDRMFASNNSIQVGDTITFADGSASCTVTGLVALSDYSTMFRNNTDTMFDALTFGVAILDDTDFAAVDPDLMTWNYAWKYEQEPSSEAEEEDRAADLMQIIFRSASLTSFVPRYANQAINFTGNDMGSDRAMVITILYMVIVIMAFVFGVTASNTVVKEASAIGTLRAMGYTSGELTVHYMAMPLLTALAGALAGNILGYTVFKDFCAWLYYNSYSLPTYVTLWNADAFIQTTVVPLLMMAVITFLILRLKLRLPPRSFLRGELSVRRQQKAPYLPAALPFFSRFRLRILLQNAGNYLVLYTGILFANVILLFGLALPDVLKNYQAEIQNNMLADYTYILSVPVAALDENHKLSSFLNMLVFADSVQTDNPDAEKFSAGALMTTFEEYRPEEIMLYGVEPDSRYVSLPLEGMDPDEVYISSALSEKYLLRPGDTLTLSEKYEDTRYSFHVAGVYDYMGGLVVFMDRTAMNDLFSYGKEYFSGYFSSSPITDIDPSCIGSVLDLEALTAVSRQLDHSMGDFMYVLDAFAVAIFMIVIYLLSRIIIEKNAHSISMVKIMGYTDREISRLYIRSTTIFVFLSILISLPPVTIALRQIFRSILMDQMSGWLPLHLNNSLYVKLILIGICTYSVVAFLEFRKIRQVPMDEALKNVE